MKELKNDKISISVSSHGAELCSIKCNGKEYLWQADPLFWKRHSPVLFPIVGSVWQNVYRVDGKEYSLTQHGFARDMDFRLVSESEDEIHFQLTDDKETHLKYPYHFLLDIGYRIKGDTITVLWSVRNNGDEDMYFQIGAHPAFYYPDFQPETTGRGYFKFDRSDNISRIRITEKGCADTSKEYPIELKEGLLKIDTHTFDGDALIIQDHQISEVTLLSEELKPYLRLRFDTPVVGLWSPPAKNAPFVCIEPWYGRCDSVNYEGEYKDKDYMNSLSPGGVFNGGYEIEII